MIVFDQAWRLLRDNFFDPEVPRHRLDAARAAVEPYIAGARTPDEMRRILVADDWRAERVAHGHLGAAAAGGANRRRRRASWPGLRPRRVREVRAAQGVVGRAARAPRRSRGMQRRRRSRWPWTASDRPAREPRSLLENKVNRRTVLSLVTPMHPVVVPAHDVAVRPISAGTERGLRYRQWVAERREYVASISKGRLGYVHMPDMSAAVACAVLPRPRRRQHGARRRRDRRAEQQRRLRQRLRARRPRASALPQHDPARHADEPRPLGRSGSGRSRSPRCW